MKTTLKTNKNRTPENGKILSIHSGKSGVGKSQLALNLALALRQCNQSVLLIDTNILESRLHRLLGVTPQKSLADAFIHGISLNELIESYDSGLHMIYGVPHDGSDISNPQMTLEQLITHIQALTKLYDFIILDQAAGLSEFIQMISAVADEVLIVTTPESDAVSDAYALVKVLAGLHPTLHFKTVVNRVSSDREADEVFERFSLVVEHFLQTDVDLLGYLIDDKHVIQAAEHQIPFILDAPQSKAARCIDLIKARVIQ